MASVDVFAVDCSDSESEMRLTLGRDMERFPMPNNYVKLHKLAGSTVTSTFLVGLACLSVLACERKKPGESEVVAHNQDGTAASAPSDGSEKGEAKSDEAATPCSKYGDALCKELGDKNPICDSAKQVVDLLPEAACNAGMADIDYSKGKIAKLGEKCTELADKLCKDLGEETKTCEMVREKTPEFPPDRCTSMLAQYDKVLEDLEKQEAANKPLSEEKQKLISSGDVPSFGPADAKVTLVEFSDFQCPYCTRAADALTKVKEKYADKVRIVFRQYPLSFHKEAHLAAEASLAANAQGKFWEFHDLMFKNQKELKRESLEKYANQVGLDVAAFKKALDDKTYAEPVDKELKLGSEVAVQGTPTMFLNGTRVGNPTDFDAIAKEIDKALGESE